MLTDTFTCIGMSRAKFRRTVSCLLIGLATGISDVIAGNSAVQTWERRYCVDTIVQLKEICSVVFSILLGLAVAIAKSERVIIGGKLLPCC